MRHHHDISVDEHQKIAGGALCGYVPRHGRAPRSVDVDHRGAVGGRKWARVLSGSIGDHEHFGVRHRPAYSTKTLGEDLKASVERNDDGDTHDVISASQYTR